MIWNLLVVQMGVFEIGVAIAGFEFSIANKELGSITMLLSTT